MDKILEQIQGFINKTEEKKIDWKFLNPTAVRFTKQVGIKSHILTLQTNGAPPLKQYIFTIQNTTPGEVLLQINTASMPQYKAGLERLFELAIGNSKTSSSREIDDLLNSI